MHKHSGIITDIEKFKLILREKGMKATSQRIAVHEAMIALGHASADMVSSYISSHSGTGVTVASVYNVLTQMTSKGIYTIRYSPGNKMIFDVNSSKHIHIYDTKNDEFKDIEDEGLITLMKNYFRGRRFRGYKIDAMEAQIICHSTRKANK